MLCYNVSKIVMDYQEPYQGKEFLEAFVAYLGTAAACKSYAMLHAARLCVPSHEWKLLTK